jgi:outer membrane protein OmpA-like peptidoglycan-associated protein
MPPSAYGASYAQAPQAYGIAVPQPAAAPQPYYTAQPTYRSPYAGQPMMAPQMAAPAYGGYGQPGQPVALIYFREGSSSLSSNDRQVLRQMAEMQRVYGGVLRVVGHASMGSGGQEEANQRVSEARAAIVARQLMEYGVPEGAIQAIAASDTRPLYSETMPNGEAANRRAEVYLAAY